MNDLIHDDQALDEALAALPPAAVPRATAAEIMAYAVATPETPSSTRGALLWKAAVLMAAGAAIGFGAERLYERSERSTDESMVVIDDVAETPHAMGPTEQLPSTEQSVADADDVELAPEPSTPEVSVPAREEPFQTTPQLMATLPLDHEVPVFEDTDLLASAEIDRLRPLAPAPRRGATRLRVEGGMLATDDVAGGPLFGPELRFGITHLGPTERTTRPLLAADLDLVIRPHEPSFQLSGGLQLGAGLAVDGHKARFEASWTVGTKLTPPTNDMVADQSRSPLQFVTGPQLGLAIPTPSGPDLHFSTTIQGSFADTDGDGTANVQPWIGFTLGGEFGVPRSG